MDDNNWNQQPIPTTPTPSPETSRLNQEIPAKNRLLDSAKNIVVILILVAVIVGSFWISFQLGKRLLVPVKKMPQEKIEVTIPEAPSSIAHLQKLQKLSGLSGEVKTVTQRIPITRPVISGRYYKLQVGLFAHKKNAVNLTAKMKGQGIDAFYRAVGSKWRVQAGAYRTKNDALSAKRVLKNQGYDSILICE